MKRTELIDHACEYARTTLAANAKSKIVQFMIGASTVGAGKKMIEDKLCTFMPFFEDEEGNVNMCSLKESVMAGFTASGCIPVLGGVISLDGNDASGFFDYVGSKTKEETPQPPK